MPDAMPRSLAMLLLLLVPALAHAGKFGGFSSDGRAWLDGKTRVCRPLPVGANGKVGAAPEPCREVKDPAQLAGYAFRRPSPVRSPAALREGSKLTLVEGGQTRVVWQAPAAIASVGGVFVAADGALVGVEYVDGITRATRAVVFSFAAPARDDAGAPAGEGGDRRRTGIERALRHGGLWEQRLIACERAGVNLELTRRQRFELEIVTRCEKDRDRTTLDGRWEEDGLEGLVLVFQQEEGPDETLGCRFASCAEAPGEDCLVCADGDITFTLTTRRPPAKK